MVAEVAGVRTTGRQNLKGTRPVWGSKQPELIGPVLTQSNCANQRVTGNPLKSR